MKKIYERPKSEVICYSTPDITSVSGLQGEQSFAGILTESHKGLVSFEKLHD